MTGLTEAMASRTERGSDPVGGTTTPTAVSGIRRAALVIDLVDSDHLEVTAGGWWITADSCDDVAARLDQLVSCRPARLRINFASVSVLDPPVADVFRAAAERMLERGGILEVAGARPAVAARLGLPATQGQSTVQVLCGGSSEPRTET